MDYTFVSILLHFAYEQEVPSRKLILPKNNKINIKTLEKHKYLFTGKNKNKRMNLLLCMLLQIYNQFSHPDTQQ